MRAKEGFSLVELMLVVFILGAMATVAIPRISHASTAAKVNTCATNIDLINAQLELYHHNTGSWPTMLDDLTKDKDYFPDGEPVCPITGEEYVMNADHRVDTSGHNH